MSEATEAVARGAAVLDRDYPGWDQRIDLAALDLSSCEVCVLGQMFGDYAEAPNGLRWDDKTEKFLSSELGFVTGSDKYPDLTAAWRDLIAQRRLATTRADAPGAAIQGGTANGTPEVDYRAVNQPGEPAAPISASRSGEAVR